MKIPLFSKLTAKSRGRKVVRASARAMRGGEEEYYEAEPNMKLSHAFMVVLVLHVVAVGGIYAFNQIKVNRQSDLLARISGRIGQATGTASTAAPVAATTPATTPAPQRMPGDADEPLPLVHPAAPVATTATVAASVPAAPTKPAVSAVITAPSKPAAPQQAAPAVTQTSPPKAPVKAAAATTSVAAGGTYTVAKGDNPYTIAKKAGVSYQELVTLNAITDPTKLQIGQVLKLPPKKR